MFAAPNGMGYPSGCPSPWLRGGQSAMRSIVGILWIILLIFIILVFLNTPGIR